MNRTIFLLASLPLIVSPLTSLLTKPAFAASFGDQSHPTQLARISNACPSNRPRQFVHAETRSFDVYICGSVDVQPVYVGVSKNDGSEITLPVSYSMGKYDASNNDGNSRYSYILSRNWLTITRNGKVIDRERARWIQ